MLMMFPFEAPTIFEGIHKSYFRMPRVVKDQRAKFDNDELFRQLSHESQVRYTAHKERPLEERQLKFITGCQEGRTEISVVQSGNQFLLSFNPTLNPAISGEGCDFDKELGKVHIKSPFILNGVCVFWRGYIDLQRLDGSGCLEFDECRAYVEEHASKLISLDSNINQTKAHLNSLNQSYHHSHQTHHHSQHNFTQPASCNNSTTTPPPPATTEARPPTTNNQLTQITSPGQKSQLANNHHHHHQHHHSTSPLINNLNANNNNNNATKSPSTNHQAPVSPLTRAHYPGGQAAPQLNISQLSHLNHQLHQQHAQIASSLLPAHQHALAPLPPPHQQHQQHSMQPLNIGNSPAHHPLNAGCLGAGQAPGQALGPPVATQMGAMGQLNPMGAHLPPISLADSYGNAAIAAAAAAAFHQALSVSAANAHGVQQPAGASIMAAASQANSQPNLAHPRVNGTASDLLLTEMAAASHQRQRAS